MLLSATDSTMLALRGCFLDLFLLSGSFTRLSEVLDFFESDLDDGRHLLPCLIYLLLLTYFDEVSHSISPLNFLSGFV